MDRDGEVVIVTREVFSRRYAAISFSLRESYAKCKSRRLTVRTVADAVPQAFAEDDALLELVHALSHGQETVVGLSSTREGVQEGI